MDQFQTSELTSSISTFENSLKRNDSQVAYFGFYATAFDVDYIDQVKNISNLVHIDSSNGDINFIINALKKAKTNKMSAVVSVQNIFYDCSSWNCEFRSRNESLKKWNQLRNQINSNQLLSTIFSFYTDEPEMYARIRESKAASKGIKLKIDFISELEQISSIIKSNFPKVKMQMTSSAFDVHSQMVLPRGFDIFGMDCYNGWEACGTEGNKHSIPEYYEILTRKIEELENIDKKPRFLALLPPSFYVENERSNDFPTKELTLDLFDKYVSYSRHNFRVIAIMPFLWPNQVENENTLHGAKEFTEFTIKVTEYFSGFSNQNPLVCDIKTTPAKEVKSNCAPGHTGTSIKRRNVFCQNGLWKSSNWVTDSLNCKKIAPPVSTKKPAVPVILSGGTGCEDNLCLWVITKDLYKDYRILIRDPKNFGNSIYITTSHRLLRRQLNNGTTSVSFKIPTDLLNVYLDRGLDVVLINSLDGNESMYAHSFSNP